MQSVEARVDRLEAVLEEFVKSVGIEFNKLYNSQMRTESELKAFKEEMRIFREESEKDRKTLHKEMRDFKDEMREIKSDMNRKWGEMANKLGTITEDLVAPSLPRIVKEEFDLEVIDLIVRRKRSLKMA